MIRIGGIWGQMMDIIIKGGWIDQFPFSLIVCCFHHSEIDSEGDSVSPLDYQSPQDHYQSPREQDNLHPYDTKTAGSSEILLRLPSLLSSLIRNQSNHSVTYRDFRRRIPKIIPFHFSSFLCSNKCSAVRILLVQQILDIISVSNIDSGFRFFQPGNFARSRGT